MSLNIDNTLATLMCFVLASHHLNQGILITYIGNVSSYLSFTIKIFYIYYSNRAREEDLLSFYAYFSVILILGYILIVSVYVEYQREKNKRKNFLAKQNIHTLKAETDEILAILVPKFVLEKLSFQSTSLA